MTWRGLAADDHRVAAAAGQRRRRRVASGSRLSRRWSSVGDLEIGAEPDRAAVGSKRAGQQIDQRRLAGAVRPDDADPVAALDA